MVQVSQPRNPHMQRLHLQLVLRGGGEQWLAVIHVTATLSGCCASPVLVTLTHLSTGNGQVMKDSLVMSPNSYGLKSTCQNLTQNIRSLHVYFCFSKPWPQHQTIGGWRAA